MQLSDSQAVGTHGGGVVVVVVVVVVVGQAVVVVSSVQTALKPSLLSDSSVWNFTVMVLPWPIVQLVNGPGIEPPQNLSL